MLLQYHGIPPRWRHANIFRRKPVRFVFLGFRTINLKMAENILRRARPTYAHAAPLQVPKVHASYLNTPLISTSVLDAVPSDDLSLRWLQSPKKNKYPRSLSCLPKCATVWLSNAVFKFRYQKEQVDIKLSFLC